MDPLARNYEVDKFTEKLSEWCKKVVKTKETIETTFILIDNVDVDRMKADVCALIDEAFGQEKSNEESN